MIDPEIAKNGGLHRVKIKETGMIIQIQVIANTPKKMLNHDVIEQIIGYESTGTVAIMDALDVGRTSAKITYYRFVFNILSDLNYHFVDKRGRMRKITLNHYCDAVNADGTNRIRRGSIDESSVKEKNSHDGEKSRKRYTTNDRHYRFAHLDNNYRNDDSASLKTYTVPLEPVYNDIKRLFI